MKLLIYGSKGWIGKQFIKVLEEQNINFIEGLERVDNTPSVINEIENILPTHIISFIGRTHGKIGDKVFSTIDYLEEEGKLVENIRDNLYSPLTLALICQEKNIHFSYLGTGCIFEYDEEHTMINNEGFTEDSLPNFFGSSYSIVKGFTDRIMKLTNTLNVRIRMPINSEKCSRNFITKITNYEKICSISNSMTVLPELLPYLLEMLKNNLTGTINLTNPGVISHNEILELYRDIVDPDFKWQNFTIEEQDKILSSKRSNNYLETKKLQELFPDVKNIKESVIDCLKKYPKPTYFENSRNTNILVTGGCGFIGSHYVNYIFDKYDQINIINVDAMYYCSNEYNVNENVRNSSRYTLLKQNLNHLEKDILDKYKITHVIHFAAQSHVQNSFEESLQYTEDNVRGTHALLEKCRKYNKLIRFIHVSTDEVYGESKIIDGEEHKTELSILCPTNPYAGTKAAAELIAQTYIHSFNLPIIITRGNNVYGPNQYPEKLIPRFIKLLQDDKKVTIQGDGSAVRGFLHVYDTVTAFDIILNRGKIGNIYNIGCDGKNMEYSVLEIAKILIKEIKETENYEDWIEYVEDRPFNDQRYYISNSKLKKLGWEITKEFHNEIKNLIKNNS